ncbi:DNA-binding protein [Methylomicrobium sp. Wu6]|uniref:DNA-binding protein n=1 Tax=Methylomicrobium sp. Wu6 TaxID=3107928 RepID=UPI002DD63AC1|nr:DNA-binding protein [Methylomicrobium sp. Wu6]MEC4750035.1 DNA-binding protein [Methylomicrobium sp. Wu6]
MKKPLTPEQVKEQFQQRGQTFSAWAKNNGYTRNEVYRVLNGQTKAKYGKCYEIAVKLGLKVDSSQQAA